MGFVEEGKKTEVKFAKDFAKNYNIPTSDIIFATPYEDMYEHFDVAVRRRSGIHKFDVKGLRKINRWDSAINPDVCYLEFVNVNGDDGWPYGKSNFIAFEQLHTWIVVMRESLVDYIEYKVNDTTIYDYKEPYKLYSRYERKDVITLAYIKDIKNSIFFREINKKN